MTLMISELTPIKTNRMTGVISIRGRHWLAPTVTEDVEEMSGALGDEPVSRDGTASLESIVDHVYDQINQPAGERAEDDDEGDGDADPNVEPKGPPTGLYSKSFLRFQGYVGESFNQAARHSSPNEMATW